MGLKLVLLLSQLAFLLVTSFSLSVPVPLPHPPAQSPSYPVPLPHPTPLPTLPPVKPPTLPPVKPPTLPPVKPPTKPPTLPPVKPPTLPPVVKPPTKPPVVKPPTPYYSKKAVAIQGVVFCKNCTYFGINTLVGAKPLANATVALKCKNVVLTATAATDKNGYFFMQPPKLMGRFIRWCKVNLVAPPPGSTCKHATNLNGGAHGGYLKPAGQTKKDSPYPYALYTVGPFAFEPSKRVCRKH